MQDIVSYLLNHGWRKSEATHAIVSPEGAVVPMDKVLEYNDAFQFGGRLAYGRWSPYDRLKARLNLPPSEDFGLDYCHIFESPNLVFVFVVNGNNAAVLEDDPGLFPSDKLIAQFRLFQETQ